MSEPTDPSGQMHLDPVSTALPEHDVQSDFVPPEQFSHAGEQGEQLPLAVFRYVLLSHIHLPVLESRVAPGTH